MHQCADNREQLQLKRQLHLQAMLDAVVFRAHAIMTEDTVEDSIPLQPEPKIRFRFLHKLLRRRREQPSTVDLDEVFVSAPSSEVGGSRTQHQVLSLKHGVIGSGNIKLQRLTLLMKLSKQLTQRFQDQFDDCRSRGLPFHAFPNTYRACMQWWGK